MWCLFGIGMGYYIGGWMYQDVLVDFEVIWIVQVILGVQVGWVLVEVVVDVVECVVVFDCVIVFVVGCGGVVGQQQYGSQW